MLLLYFFINLLLVVNCLIEQQPIFTSQPADVGPLFSGTRGILQCTASGTPQVQYRWLKNGNSLTNRSTTNGGVYLISQADRYKDSGEYQCVAENKLGSVLSNKAQLTVAYMDQIKVQYAVEVRVRYGRAAIIRLPKMFDAYPAPTIEWFAGGALIEPNAKFAITKDYNLVVLKCDKADEKSYYVEVSSIHTGTKIRSREIRLYVIQDGYNFDADDSYGLHSFDYSSSSDTTTGGHSNSDTGDSAVSGDLEFIVKPEDTIAKLNDNLVKFDCIVNSRKYALDQLEISWYKDQQLIDFIKTKYHLSSRSLEIISVTDQDVGVYTCSARFNLNQGSSFYGSSKLFNSNYVSINASARLEVNIKPTFKAQPESMIETDFGKTVQLKCDGIAYPSANVTWYKNAQLIDFDKQANMQTNESGTRLIISNIALKDQAIYQCFLSNAAGHISASTLIKIISFAPKFVEPVLNMTVYSDTNVELPCARADGSPRPRVTWTKLAQYQVKMNDDESEMGHSRSLYEDDEFSAASVDDLGIDDNEDNSYNYPRRNKENTDLILRNVNSRHQGWYKCEASNLMGKISRNFYLQVKRKTEIIEPPMNISVTKGQSAILKCTVSKEDDTDVELRWKFNDQVLELDHQSFNADSLTDSSNQFKLFRNGTLQILEAKNTDIGTYKCIVRSVNSPQAGNDSRTAYLNVVELPYAPVNVYSNLVSSEKRSVNLTWDSSFDGNSPIIKYIVQARITSFDQTLLQYEQISMTLYDWFVIKDNVMAGGYYQTSPGLFWSSSLSSPNLIGGQFKYWTIVGDLKPAFTYEFRVSAVNGIGEGMPSRGSNNVTIPEEIPSQAPQNIQAVASGPKTLTIQWQQPPVISWNGRLKGYRIAYSLSYPNSTWKYLQVDDYAQTSANLTDLIVWETYLIKMCAYNKKGYGKYNYPPVRVRTREGVPIRAPLHFRANSVNSTCIRMSWSEPPAQFVNGLIQGYKIVFYENNRTDLEPQSSVIYVNRSNSAQQQQIQSSSPLQVATLVGNQYQYQMCNLSKFTLYTMSILCFTSSGDGPPTQPIQLKTLEDVPGEVSDIQFLNVYDTSIDIEWKPPMQPNGRILSYIISFRPVLNNSHSISSGKFEHVIVDAGQLNFTLRNLKSSTEYMLGIRARTQAGDGVQKLMQIKSGVPPELPEPPKAIVVRQIGQTWVELEFIPGYDGKTSINKWIVQALVVYNHNERSDSLNETIASSKWSLVYEKSNAPNATKLLVENLKPFTNYTLRMLARNVKGVSQPSLATEVFETLADVPASTPEHLSARYNHLYASTTKSNDLDVLIKWTPIASEKWNGVPFGYVIFVDDCEATSSSTGTQRRHEIKYDKFRPYEYWLRSLSSYQCYRVSMSAWNSVGLGPKTTLDNQLVLNRTSQSRPSNYTYQINLYSMNSSSVRVVWTQLDSKYHNGILIGYKIRYQPTDTKMINSTDDESDQVISYYDNDDSNSENNYDNDLVFMSMYRAKETFYRVSSESESRRKTGSDMLETVLSNLLSYTSYKIEIAACTRAGCGQLSLPVSIRTQEYLPSRPIDLHFPAVNLTSVRLAWKAPRYPNGELLGFRVRYILKRYLESNSANQQLSWSHVYLKLDSNSSVNGEYYADISGLVKREYYIFEVSANNTCMKGWGDPARTIVYTIDTNSRLRPDSPSRPAIGKSSIKANELTISWSTNSDNYSPVRYFIIQMKELPPENSTLVHSASQLNSQRWRTIYIYKCANLYLNNNYRLHIRGRNKRGKLIIRPNGRLYKFRIAATNDVGASEFSDESVLVRTKPDVPRASLFDLRVTPSAANRVRLDWNELMRVNTITDSEELIKFKLVYSEIHAEFVNGGDQLFSDELTSNSFTSLAEISSSSGGGNVIVNELIIDYKYTNKSRGEELSSERRRMLFGYDDEDDEEDKEANKYVVVKHSYEVTSSSLEMTIDDSGSLGIYEFELCGINMVGQAAKCARNNRLVYMDDRLPFVYTENSLLKSVSPLSSIELNVTWREASREEINGHLYAYKIVCIYQDYFDQVDPSGSGLNALLNHRHTRQQELENENLIDVFIIEPEKTHTVLTNLRPYTNYTIVMQLINQAGESVADVDSIKSTAQTYEAIPSPPADLLFTYISYTHLNLTIVRPRHPNGRLLAYELWYENVLPSMSIDNSPGSIETTRMTTSIFTQTMQTTKIIRQEILSGLEAPSLTLFINSLEPQVAYKFRVRCRTSIAWGAYTERMVYTGPQLRKYYSSRLHSSGVSSMKLAKEAPMATSKPIYNSLNETHALLEWQSYSTDYEMFIVEMKLFNVATVNYSGNFEVYAYSNKTSLVINKYDKRLQQRAASTILSAAAASRVTGLMSHSYSPTSHIICQFRVFAFNSISISEPSPVSDLVQIKRVNSDSDSSSSILPSSLFNPKELLLNGQQQFYLNWWFLVIVALSGFIFLITIVVVMLARGKNKKFLMRKQSKHHMDQQKMNTIKMMKLNGGAPGAGSILNGQGIMLTDGSQNETINGGLNNANSIYLAGSNQQLILSSSSNTLNRSMVYGGVGMNTNGTMGGTINPNFTGSNQITLYEVRKSKRGGGGPVSARSGNESCNYASGTLKTGTYVSPSGTLTRFNMLSQDDGQQPSNSRLVSDMTDAASICTLKQEQLNALRNNPRHLGQLIGLNHAAQPNDYSTGAILLAGDENFDPTGTLRQQNRISNNYLMPVSSSMQASELINNGDEEDQMFERHGSRQHLYFQHMPVQQQRPSIIKSQNFNTYGESPQIIANEQANEQTNFGHNLNSIYNMSNRHIYTTNSFGRHTLKNNQPMTSNNSGGGQTTTNSGSSGPNNNSSVLINNLPPPHPSLLSNNQSNDQQTIGVSMDDSVLATNSTFEARRVNMNYMSTSQQRMNTYLEHQQVIQHINQNRGLSLQPQYYLQQQQQQQDMLNSTASPPPPPPPPPPLPPKSPYTLRPPAPTRPPPLYSQPPSNHQQQASSSIAQAASNTIEAMNVLVASTSNGQSQIKSGGESATAAAGTAGVNQSSSISINLNGDRVMMNNVAGSRKPLSSTGAGYPNF